MGILYKSVTKYVCENPLRISVCVWVLKQLKRKNNKILKFENGIFLVIEKRKIVEKMVDKM